VAVAVLVLAIDWLMKRVVVVGGVGVTFVCSVFLVVIPPIVVQRDQILDPCQRSSPHVGMQEWKRGRNERGGDHVKAVP